jgi:ABC-type multidrug transport system fused ATPase/permease subunit
VSGRSLSPVIAPWRSASRFLSCFAQYGRARIISAMGLVALGGLLESAGLLLLIPILGVVVSSQSGGWIQQITTRTLAGIGADQPSEQLAALLAAFVALMALRTLVLYVRDLRLMRLQTGFVESQRMGVIRLLTSTPWSQIVGLHHARVINLVGGEIQRVSSMAQFVVQGGVALTMLVIQSALAFMLAPAIAAVAAGLLILGAVGVIIASHRTRDIGIGMGRANLALMKSTTDFLGGLKAAIAQNAQDKFLREFQVSQAEVIGFQMEHVRRQSGSRLTFAALSALGGVMVITCGFLWLHVQPTVLITLVLIFSRMGGPAQTLQSTSQQFLLALPAFESIRALEADLGGQAKTAAPATEPPPSGPIRFDAARYQHPGGGGVKSLSLTLLPGVFLGVSGSSGAGKTTFVDLLVGLLSPQDGKITVGGAALDGGRLSGWRGAVAYVTQDAFLFHDTLRQNLTWGDPDLSDSDLHQALDFAGALPLLSRLEQGLETRLGERGALLSGGERQRIALARAILRRPQLLVLDEATNALDVNSEAALLGRMAALTPRPTIVMVAHRKESLMHCTRKIRIEGGEVIEDGSTPG